MNKGWKCAFLSMFYFVHYFLCELSFSNSYENGHPCVIRDIFCTCRLMYMKSKFSLTAGKGCWIYICAVTKALYSFGFSCVFSPWQNFFGHLNIWFWHQTFPCFISLRNSHVLPSAEFQVMVTTPAVLCPPVPGNISGTPQQFSFPLNGDNWTAPKRK